MSHWLKLDRSLDHINSLEKYINTWLDDDAQTVNVEHGPYIDADRRTRDDAVRTALVLRVKPFPTEWSTLIGDAVHNLRSSLDHLAFALNAKGYADANSGSELPLGSENASEFPIFGNVNAKGEPIDGAELFGRPRTKAKIAHVPGGVRDVIEAVQPYRDGDDFASHPLWIVYDLDRVDRHRKLVLASSVNDEISPKAPFTVSDGALIELAYGFMGPRNDGDELVYWAVTTGTKVEYNFDFAIGIAFGEGTAAMGWPIVRTLRGARNYIRMEVACKLDRFL